MHARITYITVSLSCPQPPSTASQSCLNCQETLIPSCSILILEVHIKRTFNLVPVGLKNNCLLRLGSCSLDRACMISGYQDVTHPSFTFVSQYGLFLGPNFMLSNRIGANKKEQTKPAALNVAWMNVAGPTPPAPKANRVCLHKSADMKVQTPFPTPLARSVLFLSYICHLDPCRRGCTDTLRRSVVCHIAVSHF